MLKINGETAAVLPDNVLFEGGAGEAVRKQLMKNCGTPYYFTAPDRCILCPWRKGKCPVFQ